MNTPHTFQIATIIGCTLLGVFTEATASTEIVPKVSYEVTHNSNLFLRPQAQIDATPDLAAGDTTTNLGAGLDVKTLYGENTYTLNATVNRHTYTRYYLLDNTSVAAGLASSWVATRRITGSTNLSYRKELTPFIDLPEVQDPTTGSSFFVERESSIVNTTNYELSSKTYTDSSIGYKHRSLPATISNSAYNLREIPLHLGVMHGTSSFFSIGVGVGYLRGDYQKTDLLAGYRTIDYQLLMRLRTSERMSLSTTFGISRLTQDNDEETGTTTATKVDFRYQLTNKINYFLTYDRGYSSAYLTVAPQLTRTASSGFSWSPLQKLLVATNYNVGNNDVQSAPNNPLNPTIGRKEKLKQASVEIYYTPSRWLSINSYYRNQHKTSDNTRYQFDNRIYGAAITLKYAR